MEFLKRGVLVQGIVFLKRPTKKGLKQRRTSSGGLERLALGLFLVALNWPSTWIYSQTRSLDSLKTNRETHEREGLHLVNLTELNHKIQKNHQESLDETRRRVRRDATLLSKLKVLGRVVRHRAKWEYWPIEQAIEELLGSSFRSFAHRNKIYHLSLKNDLRIVEDPIGHYFRITKSKTLSSQDVFLDRYLHPISRKDEAEMAQQISGADSPMSGALSVRALLEPRTHFTYRHGTDDDIIELQERRLKEDLHHLELDDDWIHLRPFLFENDVMERTVFLKQWHWHDFTEIEKRFLLSYSRETANRHEMAVLIQLGLHSEDNVWLPVFKYWFNDWIESHGAKGGGWKLLVIHQFFPLLTTKVNDYNRAINSLSKKLVQHLSSHKQKPMKTLSQPLPIPMTGMTRTETMGAGMTATASQVEEPQNGELEATFRKYANLSVHEIHLSGWSSHSTAEFWRAAAFLDWGELPQALRTKFHFLALRELDEDSFPFIFEIAKASGESQWLKALERIEIMLPESRYTLHRLAIKRCQMTLAPLP